MLQIETTAHQHLGGKMLSPTIVRAVFTISELHWCFNKQIIVTVAFIHTWVTSVCASCWFCAVHHSSVSAVFLVEIAGSLQNTTSVFRFLGRRVCFLFCFFLPVLLDRCDLRISHLCLIIGHCKWHCSSVVQHKVAETNSRAGNLFIFCLLYVRCAGKCIDFVFSFVFGFQLIWKQDDKISR